HRLDDAAAVLGAGPDDHIARQQCAKLRLRGEGPASKAGVTRAEDDVVADLLGRVGVELLLERGPHVDFGDDPESLLGQCCAHAPDGLRVRLVEGEVMRVGHRVLLRVVVPDLDHLEVLGLRPGSGTASRAPCGPDPCPGWSCTAPYRWR